MPIDPWLVEKFELIRHIPSTEAALSDPALGAKYLAYLQDPQPWAPPPGVTSETLDADGVPVRVFRPAASPGAAAAPALLWMHGGGFVMGTIDDTESVIPGFELAARAGALVVSVGYRLAVDGVRYPAPLDDVATAWHWLGSHATEFGLDTARLFAGGTSVGATLAAGLAVRLRDSHALNGPDEPVADPTPRGLLLAYPIEHVPTPPLSPALAADFAELPPMLRFPLEYQAGIVHNYVGRLDDLPADGVPGNFSLGGLPESWIAPAEYDDLRPSGELFAKQLEEVGVTAHLQLARGMVHGYLGRGPSLAPVAAILDFFAEALRT